VAGTPSSCPCRNKESGAVPSRRFSSTDSIEVESVLRPTLNLKDKETLRGGSQAEDLSRRQ